MSKMEEYDDFGGLGCASLACSSEQYTDSLLAAFFNFFTSEEDVGGLGERLQQVYESAIE